MVTAPSVPPTTSSTITKSALKSPHSAKSSTEQSASANSATSAMKFIMANVYSKIWPNPSIGAVKASIMASVRSVQFVGISISRRFANPSMTTAANGKKMGRVQAAIWAIPSKTTNASSQSTPRFLILTPIAQNGKIKSVTSAPKEPISGPSDCAFPLVTSAELGITMMVFA